MTAKKAHTDTMILLVVPLGFCTGTELLNTSPHSSQIALPMVKEGPPGSRVIEKHESHSEHLKVSGLHFYSHTHDFSVKSSIYSHM